MEKQYRDENKYILNKVSLEDLRLKISSVCERDEHVDENGLYRIRSLYFDDYYNTAYKANEVGVEPRYKWRIRMYNGDEHFLRLERKSKLAGRIHKDSTPISKELFLQILNDYTEIEYPTQDALLNLFLSEMYTKLLKPNIIIQYDREPYVEHAGDVRITFDMNMCYSYEFSEFFSKELFLMPIGEKPIDLLEVKFTEFCPDHIKAIVDDGRLQRTTFSKYYLGRQKGDKYKDAII